jgi:ATP-dependent Clp protease, protease subunit
MKKLLSAIVIGLSLCLASVSYGNTNLIETKEVRKDYTIKTIVIDSSIYNSDVRELVEATTGDFDELQIIINTPGGDAFACMGMINYLNELKSKGIKIVTRVSGMALSAGAYLWLAGDERIVHSSDVFMFHLTVRYNMYGQKIDCENIGEDACWIDGNLNNFLRQHMLNTIKDTDLVNKLLLDKEYWATGDELFKLGIATKLIK